MLGPARFRFLNLERDTSDDWDPPNSEKLWVYNLHYFDDLNAHEADTRTQWHNQLLEKWVRKNTANADIGWEPYPTSLRIVNWIKWSLSGNGLSDQATRSLATQCRHLSTRIESHLLGNHLFANAKALLFAGLFFDGVESYRWREKGTSILMSEVDEQILPDGGHFERTPMYHLIILEDLLDCINIKQTFGEATDTVSTRFMRAAEGMLKFLRDTLHSDGELPFFNDTAMAIAPSPSQIFAYAERLGISTGEAASNRIIEKRDFGLWVLNSDDERLIIDAGPIGPDYLPGHAHCDTLSYEMSVGDKRFVVNSGVYTYQGIERSWFRSTAAHNTVRIDGEEQHEIWAAFRVARRGYPTVVESNDSEGSLRFTAAHTGYKRLPGKPLHRRTVQYRENIWSVEDQVEGGGDHRAESYIHLHPDVAILERSETTIRCGIGDSVMVIRSNNDDKIEIEEGEYSDEFGRKTKNDVLVIRKNGPLPLALGYRIERTE